MSPNDDNSRELIDQALSRAPESLRRLVRALRLRETELLVENEGLRQECKALRAGQSPEPAPPEQAASLTVGAQNFILRANERAAAMLRVTARDLVRSRFVEFLMPASLATYQARRKLLLESGDAQAFEAQLIRRGYRPFWAHLELSVELDPHSGAPLCAINVSDISEQHYARQEMGRLAALVESSNDAIFSRDLRGRIVSWNPSAQRLLGHEPREVEGRSFHMLVPKERLDEEAAILNRVRGGDKVVNCESVRVHQDGTEVPVAITVSPIFAENGAIVGISEIARDVRAEKRAQQQLQDQMRQLDLLSSTSQTLIFGDETDRTMWEGLLDRLRTSLQSQVCALYVVERDPAILQLSVAATRNGHTLPATIKVSDNLSGFVARQRGRLILHHLEESQGAEAQALARMHCTCYAGFPLLAHGSLLGVAAFSTTRAAYGPRELHVMHTVCDQIAATLERARLIGELRASESALREADQRKNDFIATLAHELRNPLAPIRNAAVAMRYGAVLDPKFDWCRDVIERQVGVMAELLEDLLDVSRLTRRRIELRLERIELSHVVRQAVETVRPLINEMQHQLSVSIPPETIVLNGDLTRLTQALGNLLNNAAKYTDRGGRIALEVELADREVVLRVRDNGIGIASDHLPKVFQLFSQVEAALTRSRGGLGIGLSLARALVNLHGGRLVAESDGPGKGSQFSAYLPIVEVTAPEVLPDFDAPKHPRQRSEPPVQRRRVLVVDDNADVVNSLRSVLQSAGHDVRVASDGEHALQLAEQYRPHAILLDIGMPEMSGYEICRRIRQQPWSEKMLIVACTGWGRPSDRALAKDAGFDHHLVKPADPEKLLSLIQ